MSGIREQTFDATGTMNLGTAMGGRVCSWLVHVEDAGSWSGSVQPIGRASGSGQNSVNLAYKDMTAGTNATAAITSDSAILIDGAGLDVSLTVTVSAGSVAISAVPLLG